MFQLVVQLKDNRDKNFYIHIQANINANAK